MMDEAMYQMPLNVLLRIWPDCACKDERTIKHIAIDSREVKQGALFIAYKGTQQDGRAYLKQAVQAGAVAVLYEAAQSDALDLTSLEVPCYAIHDLQNKVGELAAHFYGNPSQDLQVFAVTGTNGKTSCCYFLAHAFSQMNLEVRVMGTLGAGKLVQLYDAKQTTPDPISIQQTLAHWRDEGVTQVVMEVSSHALTQARVNGVQFYACLFTNLSHDHLDYHGTMLRYGQAKKILFEQFKSELVVTNSDDELGLEIAEDANSQFVVSYGENGDVRCQKSEASSKGMRMEIHAGALHFDVDTQLIGEINVPNILLLVAVLLSVGLEQEQIQDMVQAIPPAPGRMELFYASSKQPAVVVDYAHSPDALEKALRSIRQHCKGKVWCVFGCGGDRDTAKRPVMGAIANEYAQQCIVTNDNPRGESPEGIAQQIAQAISADKLKVILARDAAISYAVENAEAEDWVLVAGRGHESQQKFRDAYVDFSDREYVANCLEVLA